MPYTSLPTPALVEIAPLAEDTSAHANPASQTRYTSKRGKRISLTVTPQSLIGAALQDPKRRLGQFVRPVV
jgi:hypothetical protein